jgi:23S rRNA (guanosine2251-2'-O)-methyltransferase
VIDIRHDRIEGRNAVMEALRSGRHVNKIYIKKGERHGSIFKILDMAKKAGIPVQEIEAGAFYSVVQTPGHQGVVAVVSPGEYATVDDILEYAAELKEDPFIMVLNELTDPQNLGSILRTADCLGVHGVIIPKHRACGITPAVVKVSAGAAEYVKVARVTNIPSTLEELKRRGLWIYGADAEGGDCYEADMTGPAALVIGGEDRGLGKLVKERCDILVRIPMKGRVNSLNAAVAAAILGYDIMRQRKMKHGQRS